MKQFSYRIIYMNYEDESHALILQYMRLVARQNNGILNALDTMQQQHESFSSLLTEEIRNRRYHRNTNIMQAETGATATARTGATATARTGATSTARTGATATARTGATATTRTGAARTGIGASRIGIASVTRNNILARSSTEGVFSERNTPSLLTSSRLPRIRTNFSTSRIVTRYSNPITSLPNYISESTNTVDEDILNATLNDSPVRIRPSFSQIRRATQLVSFRDISSNSETICPIDRELLRDTDNVLQILECRHFFREANLRRHFRNSPRCPLCRYDIRDYITPYPSFTSTFPSNPPRPLFSPRTPPLSPTSVELPQISPPPPPASPFRFPTIREEYTQEELSSDQEENPPPFYLNTPPLDIEDPFATRTSSNINPSLQTTVELDVLTDNINNLSGNETNV